MSHIVQHSFEWNEAIAEADAHAEPQAGFVWTAQYPGV
jgi:hypothetical protein